MTDKKIAKDVPALIPPIVTVLCLAVLFTFAAEIREAFIGGVRLSVYAILPSVFPFMILADYTSATVNFNSESAPAKILSRLLGISGKGLSVLMIGLLCGFPIGARAASRSYRDGDISLEECQLLCAAANNPSPVFVISGVGLMLGSVRIGTVLYFALVLSALMTVTIFGCKFRKTQISRQNTRQNFDIVESVKGAGAASVTLSAFIIFFSLIISVLKSVLRSPFLVALFSCFLEIGNATSTVAAMELPLPLSLGLCGFALGSSGLSVLLQAFAFTPAEISKRRIVFLKLIQGLISAVLCLLASLFI